MRKKTLLTVAVGALVLVGLTGCPWFAPGAVSDDATGTGTLRLNFSPEAEARTIDPPLVMTINDYVVSISGPTGTQSQTLDGGATTTTFSGLVTGEWTVTVNARNNDATPVIIATASASATISANQTTTVNLTVTPVSGQGTLQLDLSWPDALLAEPAVIATLTPQSGTAQNITAGFTVDTSGVPDTASYGESWDAGYYTLRLDLTDGGTPVWQEVAAVRIIEAETSVGSYTLAESDINVVALEVNIDADLQNPYAITLTGQQAQITTADDMTVTATLDPVGTPDSYEWYLNGALQSGVTGSAITIGPSGVAVSAGTAYRLSLLVTDGVTLSSEATSFEVVAP